MECHSVYVHIPFCVRKCRYCDFYSVADHQEPARRYIDSLAREWQITQQQYGPPGRVSTLFFGGGTPSVLSLDEWRLMGKLLIDEIPLDSDAEVTVECNPESFTSEKAELFAELGINRVTLGVQTLDQRLLALLGRVHFAGRALDVLNNPRLAQFQSVGVDLMYGLPGQTPESFGRTIDTVLATPYVKHLSAYELTINEGTPFGRHRNILQLPDDDTTAAMVELLRAKAAANGFEQYEVSNFAQSKYRSRHNEAYWNHMPYVGLGCSAHSYHGAQRRANVADLDQYSCKVGQGELPLDFNEQIGPDELAREMIFLGLRRTDGIDEELFEMRTGSRFADTTRTAKLDLYLREGLIRYHAPRWTPTPRGLLFADAMARDLS